MYRRPLLFLFFLMCITAGFAQRNLRDAASYITVKGDTTLVKSLIQRTWELRETNPTTAIEYCMTAIRISRQQDYKQGEARALGNLGWIHYRKGDFVKALELSTEALRISEQISDKAEMARDLNTIGAIAHQQKQYDKAIDDFGTALSLARLAGDSKTEIRSLNNLSVMYFSTQQKDSAKRYATQALKISDKIGDDYFRSICNRTLGDLAAGDGDYDVALVLYEKSLALSDKLPDALKLDTWLEIAEARLHQHQLKEAFAAVNPNLALAKKYGYRKELAHAYKILSALYKQEGNAAMALSFIEKYNSLYDSLYNEETSSRLATIQTQSDLDIKQAQIELLTKDTQLNKEEIRQKRTQLYTTIGGFIGVFILAGVLILSYQRIKKTNSLLEVRTAQLAKMNESKDKLFSIISHDFRSPLNSLKGVLALAENKNLTREEFLMFAQKLRRNFNAVSNELENLLHWSLTQMHGIQTNLTSVDVQAIIEEHISVFQEIATEKNVRLKTKSFTDVHALADEDHIRLVLRNLINNAIKFTPPGGIVEVSSVQENQTIRIQVSDTGVGIGTAQMEGLFVRERSLSTRGTNQEKGVGLGLLLCQEFIENNGGTLMVVSEPGKGSVFSFTLRVA